MKDVRIDSFLWAVRIFKTRSIAANACKNGRVFINMTLVKPSRLVHEGDVIRVRKAPINYSFKVLQLVKNRIGAKLVSEYVENVTPKEEYEVLELQRISGFINRAKGEGRPTKKDRRALEDFYSDFLEDDFLFEEED